MYNIGDIVTIDPQDYPALPNETVEFLQQYEEKPLRVEYVVIPRKRDICYYYLSYNGKLIRNGIHPFPFVDADLCNYERVEQDRKSHNLSK